MSLVYDHSDRWLDARARGDMAQAIQWRRYEWECANDKDIAEHEERAWWASHRDKETTMENPKAARAVADGKAPLDYLEPACDDGEARVLRGGALKYGRRNYRDTEMLWTTYLGSMRRHLNALFRGEDTDPDSGEHHLSHIRANAAVLQGAMEAGTLKDDRLDKVSTPLSDRVHIDGDQDAKGDGHELLEENAPVEELAAEVEPFVVDAKCCKTYAKLNENCVSTYSGKPCVFGIGPVFPAPFSECCNRPGEPVNQHCHYSDGSLCEGATVACGPDCCTTPCGSIF